MVGDAVCICSVCALLLIDLCYGGMPVVRAVADRNTDEPVAHPGLRHTGGRILYIALSVLLPTCASWVLWEVHLRVLAGLIPVFLPMPVLLIVSSRRGEASGTRNKKPLPREAAAAGEKRMGNSYYRNLRRSGRSGR